MNLREIVCSVVDGKGYGMIYDVYDDSSDPDVDDVKHALSTLKAEVEEALRSIDLKEEKP